MKFKFCQLILWLFLICMSNFLVVLICMCVNTGILLVCFNSFLSVYITKLNAQEHDGQSLLPLILNNMMRSCFAKYFYKQFWLLKKPFSGGARGRALPQEDWSSPLNSRSYPRSTQISPRTRHACTSSYSSHLKLWTVGLGSAVFYV